MDRIHTASDTLPACRIDDVLPTASARAVALSFDDGPHPTWTPRLLDLLSHLGLRATFCPVGKQVRAHPGLLRRIVSEGHHVANHSMTHPTIFRYLAPAAVWREIAQAQSVISDVVGFLPTAIRAPYGAWSGSVAIVAREMGLEPLGWSLDTEDWARPSPDILAERLLRAGPGDNILCHDGGGERDRTLDALRVALPILQRRGLEFVAP